MSSVNFDIIIIMKFEQKITIENIRNLVKSLTAMENMTLTKLKILINHKFNKEDSLDNLTKKLRNKTIKLSEVIEIFDILGYDVIVRKK